MSSKKIYIVRHGQTDYNLRGVVQGSGIDAPINETGRKQAMAFFEKNKHLPIDRIYYSALVRTRQSIQKFIDLGLPHESLPELNEISWGKYEGVPMNESGHQAYQLVLEKWANGQLDYRIDGGGESPLEAASRLRKGFKHILGNDGNHILVCMHGRAIRILMCLLLDRDLRHMDLFDHQNLCCYEVTHLEGERFRLENYTCSPI